jgi:hypothetical protein
MLLPTTNRYSSRDVDPYKRPTEAYGEVDKNTPVQVLKLVAK